MNKSKMIKQLTNNVERLVFEYVNGQSDYGAEIYPNLTEDEWWDYCVPDIYNFIDNGHGRTRYADGICDYLKFIGNDKIREVIIKVADSEGVLVK